MSGVEDRDLGFAKMLAELKKLGNRQITVGVHGNEDSALVKIAAIHEFGTRTWKPSWKQAYYLALLIVLQRRPDRNETLSAEQTAKAFSIARKLRGHTLQIPERSFLRAPFDAARDKIQISADRAVSQVLDGKANADEALQELAVGFLEPLFQNALLRVQPPNAPLTIALKKSSRPLADSGRLRQSIRAVVRPARH